MTMVTGGRLHLMENVIRNIKYKDLREAKKAIENMSLREIDDREDFDVGC
jgi:hypothetical protein